MDRINKSPSYLLRVGTRYHFRFVFPKTYCNLLAGEIRLSLQTGSLRKARPLAAMLARKTKELLESSEPHKMTITKQEIKAALGSYLRASLELNEESRYRGANPFEDQETDLSATDLLNLTSIAAQDQLSGRKEYEARDGSRETERKVNEFLQTSGFPEITKEDPLFPFVRRELLKVEQAILRVEQERTKGNYNTQTELSILSAYPTAPQAPNSTQGSQATAAGPRLKDLVKEWETEHISSNLWKPRTIDAYNGHFRVMLQIFGEDTKIGSIDHQAVKSLKDTLLLLPAGMNKKKTFKEKTIPEILKLNESEQAPTISATTVNQYITTLGAFCKWCVGNGYGNIGTRA